MIKNVVGEILLNKPKELSAVNHKSPGCLESDYDENNLYQVKNMSLYEIKENID